MTALLRSDPFGSLPQLECFVFHSLLDHDSFVRSQLLFTPRESLKLKLGIDDFAGQYAAIDRLHARVNWLIR